MKAYFSHDADARRDLRMLEIRTIYGAAGYGWFWMLVEMMREQESHTLPWSPHFLCIELSTDVETLGRFLDDCTRIGLFKRNKTHFWAESLIERMKIMREKSDKARDAVGKRYDRSTSVERSYSERSTDDLRSNYNININRNIKDPNKDLVDTKNVDNSAVTPAEGSVSEKVSFGERNLVWLKPKERERFVAELGEDGFSRCVDLLEHWILGKQPDSGRKTKEAAEALRKGRNARACFDAWVVKKYRADLAETAKSNRTLALATRQPGIMPTHIEKSENYIQSIFNAAREADRAAENTTIEVLKQ